MEDELETRLTDFPKEISFKCNKTIIDQMEKYICKIKFEKEQGTGFFTKIPLPKTDKTIPVLILCNHTHKGKLGDKDTISMIVESENESKNLNIRGRKFYTNEDYDITIIELKEKDNISHFLELDDLIIKDIKDDENPNDKYLDETIYIIQYPDGDLSVSFGIVQKTFEGRKFDFKHLCSTTYGSSGSPILLRNNKLIGIHKKGNKAYNIGTFLNYPIKEFIKNYVLSDKNGEKSSNKDKIKDYRKLLLNIKDDTKEVNLSDGNIGNEGLEALSKMKLKNLNRLILSSNSIDNIEPLINFKLDILQILNLNNNNISDIRPLGKIKFSKLISLNLMKNNISDISFLEKINLIELTELLLGDNKIEDIKVLERVKFPKIEILELNSNKISDISVLSKVDFKVIKELYLSNNKISSITVFKNVDFPNLEILSLKNNKISKIDYLSGVNFPKMKRIYLNDNNISDITLLHSLKLGKSGTIILSNNKIDKKKNGLAISLLGDRIFLD